MKNAITIWNVEQYFDKEPKFWGNSGGVRIPIEIAREKKKVLIVVLNEKSKVMPDAKKSRNAGVGRKG